MTEPDTSWMGQAACARPGISATLRTWMTLPDPPDSANLLCTGCPVAVQCVMWALDEPEFEGLAGGAVFSAKAVRATPWTPSYVRPLLPESRRKTLADGAKRSHTGQFRPKIDIGDVEELARQGLTAAAIAVRLGCKVDSLYLRLHRAGRDDVWVRIRGAGPVGRLAFDRGASTQ